MNTLVGVTKVRNGVWHIAYDHSCECGCTKKRYTFTINQKSEPARATAQNKVDEHYNLNK